jgi:hypothetical protein
VGHAAIGTQSERRRWMALALVVTAQFRSSSTPRSSTSPCPRSSSGRDGAGLGRDADGSQAVGDRAPERHLQRPDRTRQPDQQKEPPSVAAVEPAAHALGRSRGGLTTKLHLACEQGQKPLSLLLTAGQRGDSPQLSPCCSASACPDPPVVGRVTATVSTRSPMFRFCLVTEPSTRDLTTY